MRSNRESVIIIIDHMSIIDLSGIENAGLLDRKTVNVGAIKTLYANLNNIYTLEVAKTYAVRPKKLGLVEKMFKEGLRTKCVFFTFKNPEKTGQSEG